MSHVSNAADSRLRSAIIGLGKVGSRFDEESGRTVVWSHAGAYLALANRFVLTGAIEIASSNTAAFKVRCPDVPIYTDVGKLIADQRPQVVSICTPADSHAEILSKVLEGPDLRLIWCEKPLATGFADARRMVEACEDRGVKLMVSYNRHWIPVWRQTQSHIHSGVIGTIRTVRVAFPNRLFSMGSHAVDLALMLGGTVDSVTALRLPSMEESGEPTVAALLRYKSGACGIVQVTGLTKQLFAEAEIIGDDGRLTAYEDKATIVVERFQPSARYAGYRQLADAQIEHAANATSAFTAMAENAANAITRDAPLACDGVHALEVQRVLDLMAAAKA